MQNLNAASINATNVEEEQSTKTLELTTSPPLSPQQEGLSAGVNTSSDFYQEYLDGKFCAQAAMIAKQRERTKEGVKFDAGKPPMELLSTKGLREIAKVMGKGKEKYGAHNWRSGLAWTRVIGAAYRHLSSFADGEDLDPETGLSHLAHLGCCVLFLLEYIQTHPELDDRYKMSDPNKDPNRVKE